MTSLTSIRLVAPLCLLVAGLPACQQKGQDDGTGGTGDTSTGPTSGSSVAGTGGAGTGGAGTGGAGTGGAGGDGSTSSTGGSGPGDPGWTLVPLIDDESDPEFGTIVRKGIDTITGIRFESLDDGYLVSRSTPNGGAVFKTTHDEVTDLQFSGRHKPRCSQSGFVNFQGIDKSPDGYYALTNACENVVSRDGGATFAEESNGGDQLALEGVFAMRTRDDETLAVTLSYIAATADEPGPDAAWEFVWAPEAAPTIPNPVPDDQCQRWAFFGSAATSAAAYVGPDGSRVAYATTDVDGTASIVCMSNDAGRSFFPKAIEGIDEDLQGYPPDGVVFASDDVGIAWLARYTSAGQVWIARTTDGGDTWATVALPSDFADATIELRSAFFAPDAVHGWLVGYDYAAAKSLLVKTTDGGATWALSGGDLAAKVDAAGGGKLHTGFALDENHIWVGGDLGIFAANAAGGD